LELLEQYQIATQRLKQKQISSIGL